MSLSTVSFTFQIIITLIANLLLGIKDTITPKSLFLFLSVSVIVSVFCCDSLVSILVLIFTVIFITSLLRLWLNPQEPVISSIKKASLFHTFTSTGMLTVYLDHIRIQFIFVERWLVCKLPWPLFIGISVNLTKYLQHKYV